MSLSREMTGDFLSIWEEVPQFLTAHGVQVRVLLSQAGRSHELELGGFSGRLSLEARCLASELPADINPGSTVQVDGLTYRVENISRRPGLPIVSLDLLQP